MMEILNPILTADGRIDCEILHPDYGWIPFTASPDDPEAHGREVFDAASLMDVAPYVPRQVPDETPEQRLASMPSVSHAQMIGALISADIITEAEGIAWITGTLPQAVETMIASLPEEQRIIARLRTIRPSTVDPKNEIVAALALAQGKSTEDMISLFELASSL